jgi:hypothetical protein
MPHNDVSPDSAIPPRTQATSETVRDARGAGRHDDERDASTGRSAHAEPPRRSNRAILNIVLIMAALHAYIGWRLLPALPIGWPLLVTAVVLLALSTFLIPLGVMTRFLKLRESLADRLSWVGLLLMGGFSSLLVLTLLRDALLLVLLAAQRLLPPAQAIGLTRPVLASIVQDSALAVAGIALLVSVVGFLNARRVARVVDVEIPVAGLAPGLDGFTIVQLSDLHVGPTIASI